MPTDSPAELAADLSPAMSDVNGRLALVRTRLAYERTMLSWVRTSTSLITFGFGIQQFFRGRAEGPGATFGQMSPYLFGTLMVGIGLLTLVFASIDHASAMAQLNKTYPVGANYPPPPRSYARALAVMIGLMGVAAMILMHLS